MPRNEIQTLLATLNLRPGAAESAIVQLEAYLGEALPTDYAQFLRLADGGEGFVGKAYVILWGVEEMIETNKGYQVEERAVGLTLFGSNGGGEAFGFDRRNRPWKYVMVPFIGMAWDESELVGDTFSEFLQRLRDGVWR